MATATQAGAVVEGAATPAERYLDLPGDLIEAGAWRGGATIFMRAVLAAYGDTGRRVWVADSLEGLPGPDPERFPAESGDRHWTWDQLAVPLEEAKANFERYGLLDDQVASCPAGSRTPCRRRPSTAWPCSAIDWTGVYRQRSADGG